MNSSALAQAVDAEIERVELDPTPEERIALDELVSHGEARLLSAEAGPDFDPSDAAAQLVDGLLRRRARADEGADSFDVAPADVLGDIKSFICPLFPFC